MRPYYESGGIVLYHADWRQSAVIMDSGKYSLLLCDPPYGLNEAAGKNKSRGKLAVAKDYGNADWDASPPSESDIAWLRSLTVHQIIFGGNYFQLPPAKCWFVWDKINGDTDFADCEMAWTSFNRAVRLFRFQWHGMLRDSNEERFHPTQKPLALMKWCLARAMSYTDVQTVLDPYAGSGTTLVAAKQMGLSAVGCEREERYCEVIARRLSQEVFSFEPHTLQESEK